MTDSDHPGSTSATSVGSPGGHLPPEPQPQQRSFGSPLLFDLTMLQSKREERAEAPAVYYLAAMLPPPRAASAWRTVAGFGAVILAGVGLGLVLAGLLL